MTKEADDLWIEQCRLGRFSITPGGKVINQITKKELAKKRSNNPCLQFLANGKWHSQTKGRAVWLAVNGPIADYHRVSYKDKDNNNTHPDNLILRTLSELGQIASEASIPYNVPPPRHSNVFGDQSSSSNSVLDIETVTTLRKKARLDEPIDFDGIVKSFGLKGQESIINAIRGKTFFNVKEPPVKNYKRKYTKHVKVLSIQMVIDLRKRANSGETLDIRAIANQLDIKHHWCIVDAIRGKTFANVTEPTFDFHIPRPKGTKLSTPSKPRVVKPKEAKPVVTQSFSSLAERFRQYRQSKTG